MTAGAKAKVLGLVRRSPIGGVLADLYRFCRTPGQEFDLYRDWQRARREAAFIRDVPEPPATAPLLLALSLANEPYTLKIEGLLLAAMRRRGWRVKVLTSRLYTWGRRYLQAYGIDDVVYAEDLATFREEQDLARDVTKTFMREGLGFQEVLGWNYRGAWIGPQILSLASRRLQAGAPDPRDPATRRWIEELLPRAVSFVHRAERLIECFGPTLVLANEPNYAINGAMVDVAIKRGISVIHYAQPSRDDALILKRLTRETRRIHPSSVTHENFSELRRRRWTPEHEEALAAEFSKRYGGAWFLQGRNQPSTKEKGREQIFSELGLSPGKKVAVLFSHVLWDANLFYGKDLFDNYGHWFVESVRAACANPHLNWLIKLHPANIWKRAQANVKGSYGEIDLIEREIGALPPHVKVLMPDTDISTLSLFRVADYGITVRGTVGIELPCFGVPVVTAGTGRYSGFGFTVDHETAEAYLATLGRLQDLGPLSPGQVEDAKRYAYAVFRLRPWEFSSFVCRFDGPKGTPLSQNVELTARSWAEIDRVGDLARWAEWAQDLTSIDYLGADPILRPQEGDTSGPSPGREREIHRSTR